MSVEVPEGWASATLGEVIRLEYGRALSASDRDPGNIPVYGSNGVCGEHAVPLVPERGIVVGRKGTAGSVTVTTGPFWAIDTTYYVVPRLEVDFDWLAATLEHARLHKLNESTGVPGLNRDKAYLKSILLPPLDEQRRIAEVLRSVDEAIVTNHRAIDAARRIVRQFANDIAARADGTTPIMKIGDVVTGRTPAPSNEEFWNGNLPFITPGDIDDGAISVNRSARMLNSAAAHGARVIPAGSLLVTCIGSTVGKMALTHSEASTNQQINAVLCPSNLSGYIYVACLSIKDDILANAGRQAVPIINKSTFSNLEIPLLSIDAMEEVSTAVLALDREIAAAQNAISQLCEVKAHISSDLLSGRVRVPA